jgi:hypothetical protein
MSGQPPYWAEMVLQLQIACWWHLQNLLLLLLPEKIVVGL